MGNIEALLFKDTLDKKRTARGAFNRASRRKGFKGGVLTPVDYLKGKEKREYMNNGKVVTYYMVENWQEFKGLSLENQEQTFVHLIKKYGTISGVAAKLGTPKSTLYSWLTRNNIQNKPDVAKYFVKHKKRLNGEKVVTKQTVVKSETVEPKQRQVDARKAPCEFCDSTKLKYSVSGTMEYEQASACLTSMEMILVKNKNYKITVNIIEV